jgi:hypothetical protein
MGIARLDLNVGLTALLAAFLDTGLVCSAYVAIQAVQFLSNSFEKASSSHICKNVHNAKLRALPLLHRFNLFPVARKQWVGAWVNYCSVKPFAAERNSHFK